MRLTQKNFTAPGNLCSKPLDFESDSRSFIFIMLMVLVLTLAGISSPCDGPRTLDELRKQLLEGYPKDTRPSFSMVIPETAQVQLQLFSFVDVDSKQQTFTLDVYLRTVWVDPRLAYKSEANGGCFNRDGNDVNCRQQDILPQMWIPDTSFNNIAATERVIDVAQQEWKSLVDPPHTLHLLGGTYPVVLRPPL